MNPIAGEDYSDVVEALFSAALPLEPAERKLFLDRACQVGDGVKERVTELLVAHEKATEWIPAPADLGGEMDGALLPAGHKIGGFTIHRVIAEGGSSVVYEAVQDRPYRIVALKVLRHGLPSDDSAKRFNREARILGCLHHPNIAQVYEAGTRGKGQDDRLHHTWFAMELVQGWPLLDYIEAKAPTVEDRLRLFTQICDAVHYAHTHGVLHRDLKPENILVDRSGEPRILDFGVAKALWIIDQTASPPTSSSQLLGTLAYMSPEQADTATDQIDAGADVYSLGVVLYRMLCGRLPIQLAGRPLTEVIRTLREEPPAPMSTDDAEFAPELEAVVRRALQKHRQARYPTVADFAAAVRDHLKAEPPRSS